MVLAEVYRRDTGEFLCLIQCRNKHEMDFVMSNLGFTFEVDVEAIDYSEEVTLQ